MDVSIMAFGSKSFIELLWRRQEQIKEVNSYLKYWSDVCFLCWPHHLHFHITAANWIHLYVSVRLVYPAWKVNELHSDVCWRLTVKKSRSCLLTLKRTHLETSLGFQAVWWGAKGLVPLDPNGPDSAGTRTSCPRWNHLSRRCLWSFILL